MSLFKDICSSKSFEEPFEAKLLGGRDKPSGITLENNLKDQGTLELNQTKWKKCSSLYHLMKLHNLKVDQRAELKLFDAL